MAKSSVRGRKELEKRFAVIKRNVEEAVEQQLDDNADDLLNRSNGLSPQLTGAHINSGKVHRPSAFVRIVAYDKPYAVFLHESRYRLGPVSRLKPGTPDGRVGRRYLSRPYEKRKKIYTDLIGKAVVKAVNQSVR